LPQSVQGCEPVEHSHGCLPQSVQGFGSVGHSHGRLPQSAQLVLRMQISHTPQFLQSVSGSLLHPVRANAKNTQPIIAKKAINSLKNFVLFIYEPPLLK